VKEEDIEQWKLNEFGQVVTYVSKQLSEENIEDAKFIVKQKMDDYTNALMYIKDFKWEKEPSVELGPIVDILQRFRPIGWHGYGGSKGYDVLSKLFEEQYKCHKEHTPEEHTPEEITFKYILKLLKQWLKEKQ
jgi:hypothetical protein